MEILKKSDLDQYREFLQTHAKGHFMQSPEWGLVKNDWKWEAVVIKNADGAIVAGLSVLIRRVPGLPFTLMYSPRGPVCDVSDKETLSSLLAGIKKLAAKYHSYQFKIDPDIPAADAGFIDAMKSFGFSLTTGGKNFEEIQPRFVFRLNVEGRTEDEVLSAFHSKTRYNIRVALKNHVEVKIRGAEALDEFLPIMRTTGSRDGFATRPKDYFERMMRAFGPHCRLYMAYFGGVPIAGTVAIQYGDKVWYLYGASSNTYRNMMPNYLLQWEMIKWAVETKCRIYDFRGVSGDLNENNPLYGLYRFKKGFNGDFTEFAGEFDLTLNRPVSAFVNTGIHTLKKLRHMKNRRHKAHTVPAPVNSPRSGSNGGETKKDPAPTKAG